VDLLTSSKLKESGIHYLDREARTVAYYAEGHSDPKPIRIYGNPLQPEFWGNLYPFCYTPHPDPMSVAAWASAPTATDGVQIWAMHGPPRHRLDLTTIPELTGCVSQAQKIASAKPLLCVFGHFHYSWGVEYVRWQEQGDEVAHAEFMTLSNERKEDERRNGPETRFAFDFSGNGDRRKLEAGRETVFVNAAWMTAKRRAVVERNHPITITMAL
jgi:hypothetical protein